MYNPVTLFIVEGEARDLHFANWMKQCFMKSSEDVKVICLPAEQNIYMLYEKLSEDDFETDVVEVLRESVPDAAECLKEVARDSVDQVYLFFDYDPHQNNVPSAVADSMVEKLIYTFDNENENGKLYISYPMVEALYDYREGQCQSHSGCFIDASNICSYKRLAGEGNQNVGKHMGFEQWKASISCFVLRCKCLLNIEDMSFDLFREKVSVISLYLEERRLLREEGKVFVLSAFPEFLLDYKGTKFFNSMAPQRNLKFDSCPRNRC